MAAGPLGPAARPAVRWQQEAGRWRGAGGARSSYSHRPPPGSPERSKRGCPRPPAVPSGRPREERAPWGTELPLFRCKLWDFTENLPRWPLNPQGPCVSGAAFSRPPQD